MAGTEGRAHIVRYANSAFCRLCGIEREQLVGIPFAEAVPEGEENACVALLDRVYRMGQTEMLPYQNHTEYGASRVCWTYTAWAIRNEEESLIGVMVQVTDTSDTACDRQRFAAINELLKLSGVRQHELTEPAEDALHHLTAIVESSQNFVISETLDGIITSWNPRAEQIYGYSSQEVVGQSISLLIPSECDDELLRLMKRVKRGERIEPFETVRVCKHGTRIHVTISISAIKNRAGRIVGTLETGQDITRSIEAGQSFRMHANQSTVLINTLNKLAIAPDLDTFVSQVLFAALQHFRAASAALWLYTAQDVSLSLRMICNGSNIGTGDQLDHPAAARLLSALEHPLWREIVSKRECVSLDIIQNPSIPYRDWLLARGMKNLLLVPLLLDDEAIGWIALHSTAVYDYHPEELEFAQALAQQAALAIHLNHSEEMKRNASVLQERNRMAQEIHDTLAHGLTGILIQLEAAVGNLACDPIKARAHIAWAREAARDSLAEARRSVQALRPHALEVGDLCSAFASLVERINASTTTQAQFIAQGTPRSLLLEVENQLWRIGQEAMTNALKHAQASLVQITLTYESTRVQLSVQDDGQGFELIRERNADGFGLISMGQRAQQINSQFTIASHPGRGTEVAVVVPIADRNCARGLT
jgi:PAS domain S-box-containing protein